MGNSNSVNPPVEPNLNIAPDIGEITYTESIISSLDIMLDEIYQQSVNVVAVTIQSFYVVHKDDNSLHPDQILLTLAKNISQRAISNKSLCPKYVQLAVLLSRLSYEKPGRHEVVTFKDVFITHVLVTFDRVVGYNIMDVEGRFSYTTFFGQLYVQEMISIKVIHYMVEKLEHRSHQLLIAIKNKLSTEFLKPFNDVKVESLVEMLYQGNLLSQAETLDSVVISTRLRKLRLKKEASAQPTSSPAASSSVVDTQTYFRSVIDAQRQNKLSMLTRFKQYLDNIQQNPPPTFDLSQFKESSDEERKNCARAMFDKAMSHPKNIVSFATVARQILCGHSASSKEQKTFCRHLNEILESETDKMFAKGTAKSQVKISNVGTFMSELYVRECVRNDVMNMWLVNVHSLVVQNDVGFLKVQLKALQIILTKMKQKDLPNYLFFLQHIKELTSQGKIPEEFVQWLREILRTSLTTINKSSSVSSVSSGASNSAVQKQTGAIKKTSSVVQTPNINAQAQLLKDGENSRPTVSPIGKLQDLVLKMNFGNHAMIISEIAKLKIIESDSNMRKVANILISRTKYRPDLLACATEVLVKFPTLSNPPQNQQNFMIQVKLSLISQMINHFEGMKSGVATVAQLEHFVDFVKELKARSVIDAKAVSDICYHVVAADKGKSDASLLKIMNVLKEDSLSLTKDNCKAKTTEKPQRTLLSNTTFTAANSGLAAITLPTKSSNNERGNKFSTQLFNLRELSMDEVTKNIENLKIKTSEEMKTFASFFYEHVMKFKLSQVFAKLAFLIDKYFTSKNSGCRASFRKCLVELNQAPKQFEPMDKQKSTKQRHDEKEVVKFTAQLYKMGWIEREQLIVLVDTLAENGFGTNHQLEMFNVLLQIISLPLLKNGDKDLLTAAYNILVRNGDSFKSGSYEYLTYLDVLETLVSITELCNNSPTDNDGKLIVSIVSAVHNNITETAAEIKLLLEKDSQDVDKLIKALMKKALSSDEEAVLCAKLSFEIQGSSEGLFKETLVEICQQTLLNNLNGEIQLEELPEMFCLLGFIGELYNFNICNYNFIHLCFELMFDDESDYAADCLSLLMRKVGPKVDFDNSSNLETLFKKFETVSPLESKYRASIYQKLIALRLNGWKTENGLAKSVGTKQISKIEKILMEITDDKDMKLSLTTARSFISQSEARSNEFLDTLWTCLKKNSELVSTYAKLCNDLSTTGTSKNIQTRARFKNCLINFLLLRVSTFNCVNSDEFAEPENSQLATLMQFIGELYIKNIVDDQELEKLLKPATKLSFNALSKLTLVLAPKVNSTRNVRLMVLFINLEDLIQERSKKYWKKLKDDIEEINEIVTDLRLKADS